MSSPHALDRAALPSAEEVGRELHELVAELLPFHRSLSGDGVRATFDVLWRDIPLERTEVPTGTAVFDWTVPREWSIRSAWLNGPDGRRIVDLADSTLHVLGYSVPVSARLSLEELRPHLFSDPSRPEVVPFRTSYHDENWGFCLPHAVLESLPEGEYEAHIDSSLEDGHVTYAEAFFPGETDEEVLISTYADHPSLANDNTSGLALAWGLARYVGPLTRRLALRVLWSPATIGPLAWLSRNEEGLGRIRAGLVACCAGDRGRLTYKRSRRGDAEVDRAVEAVLRDAGAPHELRDFTPLGGDERQFCSPGFDLPVGVLSRTPPDEFPEYHSSADDLGVVGPAELGETWARYVDVLDVLEGNVVPRNVSPKGEPQLGKRGLYRAIGGGSFAEGALLWVLNQADGTRDLLAIAERSGLPFAEIRAAAASLTEAGLLELS